MVRWRSRNNLHGRLLNPQMLFAYECQSYGVLDCPRNCTSLFTLLSFEALHQGKLLLLELIYLTLKRRIVARCGSRHALRRATTQRSTPSKQRKSARRASSVSIS